MFEAECWAETLGSRVQIQKQARSEEIITVLNCDTRMIGGVSE